MSEHLFPDATTVAPVEVARRSDGDEPGAPGARRQRLSITAFVMGVLAIVGDLVIVLLGLMTLTNTGPTSEAELVTSVLIVFGAIAAFWAGLVFAVLGTIFGILALVRRQRRGPAIVGLVLSVITLAINVTLGVQLLFNPAQLTYLGTLLV